MSFGGACNILHVLLYRCTRCALNEALNKYMQCSAQKKIFYETQNNLYKYFTKIVMNLSCFLIYFLFSVLLQSFS